MHRIMISLPEQLMKELERIKAETGMAYAEIIRQALWEWIRK